MKKDRKVYIVLLNYNNSSDTMECLESLFHLSDDNFQIIVIDNSDSSFHIDTIEKWALGEITNINTQFPCNVFPMAPKPLDYVKTDQNTFENLYFSNKLVLVKANQNRGFSAGNNIALRNIVKFGQSEDFVWILNNDTVVTKNALTAYIDFYDASDKKLGIAGAKLLYYYKPDLIQAIGGKFNKKWYRSTHIGGNQDKQNPKSTFETIDFPIGASMFTTVKFIREVGDLCEDYFLYFEELDWTTRAKIKDWEIDWCEEAIVYHKEGGTTGSTDKKRKTNIFPEIQYFKSRKKFVNKYYQLNFSYYFSSLFYIVVRALQGKFKLSKALIKITFFE